MEYIKVSIFSRLNFNISKTDIIKDFKYVILHICYYNCKMLDTKSAEELQEPLWAEKHAIREHETIIRQNRAEDELELYVRGLERANSDLEDFTQTVSHDLKAPLRAIQSFSMLLIEDYAPLLDEIGREYLDEVRKATERMNALIENLLMLSRAGRKFTVVETIDLNELLEEIKSDLRVRLEERGGEVVAGKLPTISIPRVGMKGLLINLIDNGLKFNRAEKPTVEVSYGEDEENCIFEVKDNGIGIEAEYLSRIFTLSERLHPREYEGTGLGLNICKKILDKFGGKVWVVSRPGEGTTFCFSIPK